MQIKHITLTAVACLVLSSSVQAGHPGKYNNDNRYHDYAKVTYVEPVYRSVRISRPQRECWDEERHYQTRAGGGNRDAGSIIGGILGGAAGHQVGKGHGKTAATIAGVLIGSAIGREVADNKPERVERHSGYETVCQTVNHYEEEERLEGYRVGYRYHGREYTTFMQQRPGKKIRVRVRVVVDE